MAPSPSPHSPQALPQDLAWAITSATGPRHQAREAWSLLMDRMNFHDISASVQRLTPQIFVNLRDETEVPSRERLKGSYRYTWTKNVQLWSLASELLATLNARAIDYRLLKGAALHAYWGSVGCRTIGDFDLLITSRDLASTADALRAAGFRQEGARQIACGHGLADGAAINFNRDNCHVDVHVAPMKEPSALLSRMLSTAPLVRRVGGVDVQIPGPVHLLLHAAWHASRQTSPTDLAQGLVDVGLLAHAVPLSEVASEAGLTRQEPAVLQSGLLLQAAGLVTDLPSVRPSSSSSRLRGRAPMAVASRVPRPHHITMLTSRQVTGIPWRSGGDAIRGRGVAYRSWLRLGRPGRLEATLGGARGFLREPATLTDVPALLRPFAAMDASRATTSPWAETSLDWRFRIQLPRGVTKVRVVLGGEPATDLDAALFVNGRFHGRLVAGDASLQEVHCLVRSGSLEISIRPLWSACSQCFPPLTNLTVSIEDISSGQAR